MPTPSTRAPLNHRTALRPQLTNLDLARCKNSSMSLRKVWTGDTPEGAEDYLLLGEEPGPWKAAAGDAVTSCSSYRSEAAEVVAELSAASPSQGSPPHPEPRRPLGASGLLPNKESAWRPGSPRALLARWLARACGGRSSGAGARGRECWRMARGSSANRRAPLRPPDVARRKMLQPWTAPRSVSQVQGAAAEEALPRAPLLSARGGRKREERPPRELLLGQGLPGWLASYRELLWSLNELALLAWPGTHSARLWVGGGYC